MIRTSFSFLMLCTCLFVTSKLIHESIAAEKPRPTAGRAKISTLTGMPYVTAFDLDEFDEEKCGEELAAEEEKAAAGDESTGDESTDAQEQSTVEQIDTLTSALFGDLDDPTSPDDSATKSEQTLERISDAVPAETQVAPDSNPGTPSLPSTPTETPLSPEMVQLREQVRDVLGHYFNQHENVVEHSPWGIMHVLIAYGVDTEVLAGSRKTNAIGWLCWNGTCRGQQLFYANGRNLQTRIGPGVQGHDGQFLAMMAQSRVKSTYPMRVDGRDFTLADLIEHEKQTCEAGTELTFKLIALAHYLDSDATWKNQAGENWSIPRLIREELAQPIVGAACGGTHRMMGFTYAVRKREKEGRPIDGQWRRAKKFLDDYFSYTYYLQNEDGSFSTDFFRGRNGYGDINRRIETTGHILEWFVASLPDDQLQDPRVIKTVKYLTDLMGENKHHDWEIGPKGHALHALAIYSERVFKDKPGQRDAVLARGRSASPQYRKR